MADSTHVVALRSTWRSTAEHYKAQAFRFVRIFLGVAVSQALASLATGTSPLSSFDRKAVVAFLVPIAEVTWRQLHPALTASEVDTAPGATIVPSEVGLPGPAPTADVTVGAKPAVTVDPADEGTVNLDDIPADLGPA